jgi:hypothetical protein
LTRDELIDQYFDWMYQLVVDDRYSNKSYRKLFVRLYDTEFTYTIPMDGNRAEDGIDLRYRFGREQLYSDAMVASCLDDRPCSILEMMIALAIRCEEHIMDDPDAGDRTGQWFWSMLVSLGLGSMDDRKFDRYFVDQTLERFLERGYGRNGEGGLFTVDNGRDMRNTEIWYQMNYYLREIIREGGI